MPITKEDIVAKLSTVRGAGAHVRNVAVCDGFVSIRLADGPDAQSLSTEVARAIESMGGEIRQVKIELIGGGQEPPSAPAHRPAAPATSSPSALPGVHHIVAVGAGKGGVGKSTIAVNLAVGLSRRGLRAGLLDGDIYGQSAPTLLGLANLPVEGTQQTLYPFKVHGIKAMTIGKLVDADKPLIWRGPMAHSAFRQLALQTEWGELDYLIVDLPPGTGDVPLTMSQMLPLTGAVIVCTPQKVAQDDAVRAAGMFRQLNIAVLGVVENMSYFIGDDGKEYDLFGRGGAASMAARLGLPVLGTIPIHMALRENSDSGNATANFTGSTALAQELDAMTASVEREVQKRAAVSQAPTLTIS
jgi:ATP-binding protein involved in chromosome partitioning